MVSGAANTYTDKNNILETLGFIHGGVSDVYGVTGDVANTVGGAVITTATLIKDIDGYTGYLNTDYIHLGGKDTNGVDVSDDTFMLSDTATVGIFYKDPIALRRCDCIHYRCRKAYDCG